MIYQIYAVQDVLVGFNSPFILMNDEIAKRAYKNNLKDNPNAKDMRLFHLGNFDDETGTIIPEIPKCIEGGGE